MQEDTKARKINTNVFFLPPFIILPFLKSFKHPLPNIANTLSAFTSAILGFSGALQICLCLCLFLSLFVLIRIFLHGPSSVRLVIFCLVAPYMPLCLSAVADTADLYKCRKLQQIIKRANTACWQVAVCKKGMRYMCGIDSQML